MRERGLNFNDMIDEAEIDVEEMPDEEDEDD
jgi:hypothetical protein